MYGQWLHKVLNYDFWLIWMFQIHTSRCKPGAPYELSFHLRTKVILIILNSSSPVFLCWTVFLITSTIPTRKSCVHWVWALTKLAWAACLAFNLFRLSTLCRWIKLECLRHQTLIFGSPRMIICPAFKASTHLQLTSGKTLCI